MLIEIDDSIVSEAENGNTEAVDILRDLIISYSHGIHFVYANSHLLNRIIALKKLGDVEKMMYIKLKGKLKIIVGIRNIVVVKCILTYNETSRAEEGCIYINPADFKEFCLFEKTVLIGENLNDCKVFRHISDKYLCCHKLWGANCIFFEMNGGGATTVDEYENQINNCTNFCLCIIDSDKKFPSDEIGGTAVEVKNKHTEIQPPHCDYYIMEDVSEVENLLPHEMVKKVTAINSNLLYLLRLDIAFLDMKKGIVKGVLQNTLAKDYYCDLLSGHQQELDEINACYDDVSQRNLNKQEKKECIVPGFGTNLLKDVLGLSWDEIDWKKLKLTDSQVYEWEEIGKRVFSWTCAPKRNRTCS